MEHNPNNPTNPTNHLNSTKSTTELINTTNSSASSRLESLRSEIKDIDFQLLQLTTYRDTLVDESSSIASALGLTTVRYSDGAQLIYTADTTTNKLNKVKLLAYITPAILQACTDPVPRKGYWQIRNASEKGSRGINDKEVSEDGQQE